MSFEIKEGHALAVLRSMPAESVQCCITSPPYYGLRSYGTEPQIWGGSIDCPHEFGAAMPFAKQDNRTAEQKAAQGANVGSNINFNGKTTAGDSGNFCLKCDAWRGELGLEPDFKLYISHLIEIFTEVKRVLKKDGTCFVNLGDSYAPNWSSVRSEGGAGIKENERARRTREPGIAQKSLMNIPARFAIAMTDELRMIQRNEIIWHKPACMPSSAKDRFTVDFESIFFFSKEPRYKFNQQLEPATGICKGPRAFGKSGNVDRNDSDLEIRNKRCVWNVAFEPSGDEHYAAYPTKLVEPMLLAGTDEGDTVLDIFNGTGTTGLVAVRNRRQYIGIELKPDYVDIAGERLAEVQVKLF